MQCIVYDNEMQCIVYDNEMQCIVYDNEMQCIVYDNEMQCIVYDNEIQCIAYDNEEIRPCTGQCGVDRLGLSVGGKEQRVGSSLLLQQRLCCGV